MAQVTTKKIASALLERNFKDCAHRISPPWLDIDDTIIKDAYSGVQQFRRQRAGLVEIWPHRKAEFDFQFEEKLMELARDVHEALFEDI